MRSPLLVAAIIAVTVLLASPAILSSNDDRDRKEDLYVFGVFGQSNGAYHYEDVGLVNGELDPIPAGNAFYFGFETRPVLHTSDDDPTAGDIYDMCPNGSWTIGNIEASFAKSIVESGRKVLVINFAISGFSISQLVPGGEGWDWETAVIGTALSKVDTDRYNPIMSGILCVHGESDSLTDTQVYKDGFRVAMGALYGYGFDCSLISYVRPTAGHCSLDAQRQLISETPEYLLGCSETLDFTVENGLMRFDDLHYSQKGDNVMGAAFAKAWLDSAYAK